MNTTCSSEFMGKGCMCLSDPVDPFLKICAYINYQNGLVRPCDPGCCAGDCPTIGSFPRQNMEYRRSTGADLPEGYGNKLATSDLPTETEGATPLGPLAPPPPTSPLPQFQKVWQLFAFLFGILAVALLAGFLA